MDFKMTFIIFLNYGLNWNIELNNDCFIYDHKLIYIFNSLLLLFIYSFL